MMRGGGGSRTMSMAELNREFGGTGGKASASNHEHQPASQGVIRVIRLKLYAGSLYMICFYMICFSIRWLHVWIDFKCYRYAMRQCSDGLAVCLFLSTHDRYMYGIELSNRHFYWRCQVILARLMVNVRMTWESGRVEGGWNTSKCS